MLLTCVTIIRVETEGCPAGYDWRIAVAVVVVVVVGTDIGQG